MNGNPGVKRTFGQWIAHFRDLQGLKREELAKVLGVHHTTIDRYETKQRLRVDVKHLQDLMRRLDNNFPLTQDQLSELSVSFFDLDPSPRSDLATLDKADESPDDRRAFIGLICPGTHRHGSSFWGNLLESAAVYARTLSAELVYCVHDDAVRPEEDHLLLFQAIAPWLTGIILAPAVLALNLDSDRHLDGRGRRANLRASINWFAKRSVPVVFLDRIVEGFENEPYVRVDNRGGADKAVSFLISNGHRKIGALLSIRQTNTQRERKEGYMAALRRNRRTIIDEDLVKWGVEQPGPKGNDGYRRGRANTRDLLEKEPTAIFCATHYMADEALHVIEQEKKMRVPEDISIICFDDVHELEVRNITRLSYDVNRLTKLAIDTVYAWSPDSNDADARYPAPIPAESMRIVPGKTVGPPPH